MEDVYIYIGHLLGCITSVRDRRVGWLPCGLVYSTLIWSSSHGSAGHSALLMLFFGLGTLPTLLATGAAAERLTALLRRRSLRVSAALVIILFGLWTLPGPHQHWLMQHLSLPSQAHHGHE